MIRMLSVPALVGIGDEGLSCPLLKHLEVERTQLDSVSNPRIGRRQGQGFPRNNLVRHDSGMFQGDGRAVVHQI